MTSLGAKVDTSINNGREPYLFRISGQIYHWIGSMCPQEADMPWFLQLYIYDTNNEVQNRMAHFDGEEQSCLKRVIIEGLIDFLDNHNALVQLFCTARNKRADINIPEFKLRLCNVIGTRRYDLPTPETIRAIIFGGKMAMESEFDLIVEEHSHIPQRTFTATSNSRSRAKRNINASSVLFELEAIVNSNSRTLKEFGLPMPPRKLLHVLENRVIMEERNYNRVVLLQERDTLLPKLNKDQKLILDDILKAVTNNQKALIFVYGHGGTGKTFLWKSIASVLRSEERIVLTVASSGIASLLLPSGRTTQLPSGRTAHSRFKIPLNLHEECTCNIKNSQLADLLRETDLIIWDEAPMNDRRCFEALDRCLRDILDNLQTVFGGKTIILDDERSKIQRFSSWLLDVGDGNIGDADKIDVDNSSTLEIPNELCIQDGDTAITDLISSIYDGQTFKRPTAEHLQKKVIVCPKNETTDIINTQVLSALNEREHVYLRSDDATPHGNDGGETKLLYPNEYLNTLNFGGLPPQGLELKLGVPIILLRNLNLTGGLCNGTRIIVTQLLNQVIEASIITGTRISEKVFLPCISLINRDLQMPFVFKRKQFPIKLSYAMTINKSQGQSLEKIGVFLPEPIFAHGQFGFNLPFLIWDETTWKFDMNEYAQMSKPVVIVVSSTWATTKYEDIPSSSTQLNHSKYKANHVAQMKKKKCKTAIVYNHFSMSTHNTISPEAHTFTPNYNVLVNTVENKDTRSLPDALKALENATYIFQYRFGQKAKPGRPNFSLDVVFSASPRPLLRLPLPVSATSPPQELLEQTSSATHHCQLIHISRQKTWPKDSTVVQKQQIRQLKGNSSKILNMVKIYQGKKTKAS
nr:ATP-dependent DNA helicase PIF1-like [Tanacetum cinerariifolium]GEX14622.1 ATP-dependent DNA helicase PIF1-like [Tanacetum cinerariifolium]